MRGRKPVLVAAAVNVEFLPFFLYISDPCCQGDGSEQRKFRNITREETMRSHHRGLTVGEM